MSIASKIKSLSNFLRYQVRSEHWCDKDLELGVIEMIRAACLIDEYPKHWHDSDYTEELRFIRHKERYFKNGHSYYRTKIIIGSLDGVTHGDDVLAGRESVGDFCMAIHGYIERLKVEWHGYVNKEIENTLLQMSPHHFQALTQVGVSMAVAQSIFRRKW